MRWNAARHTKRPPASNKGARLAWDLFAKPNWDDKTKTRIPETRTPKEMTYRFMDYWVWVMEFTNGEYEEIDGLCVAHQVRHPELYVE